MTTTEKKALIREYFDLIALVKKARKAGPQ